VVLQEKTISVMKNPNDVTHQMEKIRYIFQHALYISTEQENVKLQEHLESVDPEFRAVAYEGVAMGLAVKDLFEGTLQRWRAFMRSSAQVFLPHVHVGLGWAIAKQKIPSLVFLDAMQPLLRSRVIDGFGYYDGTFKQLQAVANKTRPDCILSGDFSAYDQGIGRSLWYSHKGDVEKISATILTFTASRQPHLWRGVGIASIFVGKCASTTLEELMMAANHYKIQLGMGATIVAKARMETKTITHDVENACRKWCDRSTSEVISIASHVELASGNEIDGYNLWLRSLESELSTGIWNLS
jgi:enediyne biosynthesis protein E3